MCNLGFVDVPYGFDPVDESIHKRSETSEEYDDEEVSQQCIINFSFFTYYLDSSPFSKLFICKSSSHEIILLNWYIFVVEKHHMYMSLNSLYWTIILFLFVMTFKFNIGWRWWWICSFGRRIRGRIRSWISWRGRWRWRKC